MMNKLLQESIMILHRNITIARYYKDFIDENVDLEIKIRDNCPFHDDRTASFTYKADENYFHCFGCGIGGKVPHLHFLKRTRLDEVENFTIYDAVIELADLYKIDIPLKSKRKLNREYYEYALKDNSTASEMGFKNALLDKRIRNITNKIKIIPDKKSKYEYYNLLDVVITADISVDEKLTNLSLIEKLISNS